MSLLGYPLFVTSAPVWLMALEAAKTTKSSANKHYLP